jgi:3-keto-L-gulonate-6-phosphate decarboxylase
MPVPRQAIGSIGIRFHEDWLTMTSPHPDTLHVASERVLDRLRREFTFQISVDTDNLPLGLSVAAAALAGGITIVEMGTPLLKCEGVVNVVPAFRRRFPEALLLADMKTMDGGAFEARAVYRGGGNIIDFLALAGVATAKAVCAERDEFRRANPDMSRLAFADILLPQQGSIAEAVEVACRMRDAGVDGVGVHLQLDARRAEPGLTQSGLLADAASAIFARIGSDVSVQVVGGLSVEQALDLARNGLRAFVVSGNLGFPDGVARYGLPSDEIERHVAAFIAEVMKG